MTVKSAVLRLLGLSIRNFMSYGNNTTLINLERPGTTLIVGEDLDNTTNGHGSNGCGKSAIIHALSYAVYDRAVSKLKHIDSLVNNINKKGLVVELTFIATSGKHYRIRRERKAKAGAAGNTVSLFEDNVDISLDSAGTNALIESIVGIPYEVFVRIVVFSASHIPFLDLPASHPTAPNQRDIIEELFGMTELSDKSNQLKEHIKAAEASLNIKETTIALLEKEHSRHLTQIENSIKRVEGWKVQNTDTIDKLFTKLEKIEHIDVAAEKAAHVKLEKASTKLANYNQQLKTEQRSLRELQSTDKTVTAELIHLRNAKCPRCMQDYTGSLSEVEKLSNQSLTLSSQLLDTTASIHTLNGVIIECTSHVCDAKAHITVVDIDELLDIKNQSVNIKAKIKELDQAVNPFIEPHDELLAIKLDPIDYDEVNALTVQVTHQRFLLKLLTKSDSFVRKSLLKENIKYLNSRLRLYLVDFGLPHRVEFTHEMTAKITQVGRELDFGNLSNGQKARLGLALSFAFIDILQLKHGKINVCMLDEVLDVGLDAIGVAAAARVIKRKAASENLSIYIISHKSEIEGVFDNQMTVQMSKGFSSILNNQVEDIAFT